MDISSLASGSSSRFFESYPSADFITTPTVPWTLPALFIIFPILFVACTLQFFLFVFGPSNQYDGPEFFSRPTAKNLNMAQLKFLEDS